MKIPNRIDVNKLSMMSYEKKKKCIRRISITFTNIRIFNYLLYYTEIGVNVSISLKLLIMKIANSVKM